MNTTYSSPYQTKPVRSIIDVRNTNHPVREEVRKLCGSYDINVSFEEDTNSLKEFRHIPGLIAVLCKLSRDGQIIAFGRSCAVFTANNRYIDRTINTVINGSFLSAANSATKVFEALRIGSDEEKHETKSYSTPTFEKSSDKNMSDKQKKLLSNLITTRIHSKPEQSKWLQELESGLTSYEASQQIASLLKAPK